MAGQWLPEDFSKHIETLGSYPVEITSYRLGPVFYAKAEIKIPGAGARLAWAQGETQPKAEEKVRVEARARIERLRTH